MLTTRPGCQKVCKLLLLLSPVFVLTGCEAALFDPKGLIGMEQRTLIITSFILMMLVVVPAMLLTLVFAWRYRASNKAAKYTPDWAHSSKIEVVIWSVPLLIILILGTITYISAHKLDPRNPIPSKEKTMTIEVIAMDWKWLFIYPDLGIAAVNQVAFPVNTPVEFKITSNSVMNSFFIPQLGSQIYAMAGMENRLHLIANEQGAYMGFSSNYSGQGFSGMKFTALATTREEFNQWVSKVKDSSLHLNSMGAFEQLAKPSENNPVAYYSTVENRLYNQVIDKFMGPGMHSQTQPHSQMQMQTHTSNEE
ncbi:MAG: ubiquinol oxidase subunit II [Enterobacteriaceae bacterium]